MDLGNRQVKRIFVFEVNWMGDILFTFPFLKALKNKFPGASIYCGVVGRYKELLENNPVVEGVIEFDERKTHRSVLRRLAFVRELRKRKFDLAFVLHRSFGRALLVFLAGIPVRAGFKTKRRRASVLNFVIEEPLGFHKVEYFLKLAEAVGADICDKDYKIYVGGKEKEYIDGLLEREGISSGDRFAVLHPGGNWPPKRWPAEKFAALADRLVDLFGLKIIISGAASDGAIAEEVRKNMRHEPTVFCGKTTLGQLAALMQRAAIVVSSDSGPMHLAVAVRTKVISLFGPTDPGITGPYGTGPYIVINKNSHCEVPCYDENCEKNECMDSILVEDVIKEADRLLSGS